MNDIEKAIEILSQDICYIGHRFTRDKYDKAVQTAIHALEKQVSKNAKNIHIDKGIIGIRGYCPVCGACINDVNNYKYCGNCGTAMDWSVGK